MKPLEIGKIPPHLLARLLEAHPARGDRVVIGPGIGLDCAVVDFGDRYLVAKTDPITFTSERIGWYVVHINANDVATTGAQPSWFLVTALFPAGSTGEADVEHVFQEIGEACASIGAQFIGGHTEITEGLERPILVGTMLGEVEHDRLVTPRGARPGDLIMLTKSIPIEAISIIASDHRDRLTGIPDQIIRQAANYLTDPGISVVPEAVTASRTGGVTAMHDPTEGGLAAGLWELAEAAAVALHIRLSSIPISEPARAICDHLGLDPLTCIASGALLITVARERSHQIASAIRDLGVGVTEIGEVRSGSGVHLLDGRKDEMLVWPETDGLTTLYQTKG